MAWIGPAIAGGASILGGMMGQQNNAATNATNMAINQQTMGWETNMSDTAMQRRVTDLDAAGLNPLLAVSQGGASTPGFSPIAMQSSNAMGQGISQAANNAVQVANTEADTRQKNATAAMTEANTPDDPDITRNNASYLSAAQTTNALKQSGILDAQLSNLKMQTNQGQAALNNAIAQLPGISASSSIADMDASTQKALMPGLIKAAQAEQAASQSSAQAQDRFNNGWWGRLLHSVSGGPSNSGSGGGLGAVAGAAKVGAALLP